MICWLIFIHTIQFYKYDIFPKAATVNLGIYILFYANHSDFFQHIYQNFTLWILFIFQVELIPNRISQTEMAFKQLDMNKDGFITKEEFRKVRETSCWQNLNTATTQPNLNKSWVLHNYCCCTTSRRSYGLRLLFDLIPQFKHIFIKDILVKYLTK